MACMHTYVQVVSGGVQCGPSDGRSTTGCIHPHLALGLQRLAQDAGTGGFTRTSVVRRKKLARMVRRKDAGERSFSGTKFRSKLISQGTGASCCPSFPQGPGLMLAERMHERVLQVTDADGSCFLVLGR